MTAGSQAVLESLCSRLSDLTMSPEVRGVLVDIVVDMMVDLPAKEARGRGRVHAALRGAATDSEWWYRSRWRALRALSRVGGEEGPRSSFQGDARLFARGRRGGGGGAPRVGRAPPGRGARARRSDFDRRIARPACPPSSSAGRSAAGSPFDERDTTFLAHAATAGDPRARRAAVEAVAALRIAAGPVYAGAVEVLGFALTDEEHDVQIAAARALGRLCSTPDAPRASDVLELVDRSGAADLMAATVRAIGEGMVPAGATPSARRAGRRRPRPNLVAALALFARGALIKWRSPPVDALAAAHRGGCAGRDPALAAAVDHPDEAVAKAALPQDGGAGLAVRCGGDRGRPRARARARLSFAAIARRRGARRAWLVGCTRRAPPSHGDRAGQASRPEAIRRALALARGGAG